MKKDFNIDTWLPPVQAVALEPIRENCRHHYYIKMMGSKGGSNTAPPQPQGLNLFTKKVF
jgi:hypothetical protein